MYYLALYSDVTEGVRTSKMGYTVDPYDRDTQVPACNAFKDRTPVGCALFKQVTIAWLSGVPDYFGRKWISSGGDLSHYSSASLY